MTQPKKSSAKTRKAPVVEASAPPPASPAPAGKIGAIIELLRREEGASIGALTTATGWQAHSVRGAIAGTLKKKLGLTVTSDKVEGVRTYRIAGEVTA